jgi:hypothetical protein
MTNIAANMASYGSTNLSISKNQQKPKVSDSEIKDLLTKQNRYHKAASFVQKMRENIDSTLKERGVDAYSIFYNSDKLNKVLQRLYPTYKVHYKNTYNIDISDFDWLDPDTGKKINNITSLQDVYIQKAVGGDKNNIVYNPAYNLSLPLAPTQEELNKIKTYQDQQASDQSKAKEQNKIDLTKKTKLSYK